MIIHQKIETQSKYQLPGSHAILLIIYHFGRIKISMSCIYFQRCASNNGMNMPQIESFTDNNVFTKPKAI